MWMPVRSEADAFRVACGLALIIGLSVVAGAVLAPLAGVALCAAGLLGTLWVGLASGDRDRSEPLREASRSEPVVGAPPARRRILVVANQTVGGEELRAEIVERRDPELRIVVPVLCSRAHYVTSDIDREIDEARTRLDATVRWARQLGFDTVGTIGDANPLIAIEDELRQFGANEVIISTLTPERSHWLDAGVVERAREELDIPVTHVIVDIERQPPAFHLAEEPAPRIRR